MGKLRRVLVVGALLCGTFLADSSRGATALNALKGPVRQKDTVTAGQAHSCVLRQGVPWCTGSNQSGQLGDGADLSGDWSRNALAPSLTNRAVSVSAGGYHTCVIRVDASLWCWGNNVYGQLGIGNSNNSSTPVQVGLNKVRRVALGLYHSCAVLADATMWCWGRNSNGQLGVGKSTKNRLVPVQVSIPEVATVALGTAHTCAITQTTALWCWGANYYGQVGVKGRGQKPTPTLLRKIRAKSISLGEAHTCYIGMRGATWCWGRNHKQQLAHVGGPTSKPVRMPVGPANAVATLNNATCSLQATSLLWCWGGNSSSEIAVTGMSSSSQPQLAPVQNVSRVVVGGGHVCVIHAAADPNMDDAVSGVSCWGNDVQGQLGDTSNWSRVTASRLRFPGTSLPGVSPNADGAVRVVIAGDIGCQPTTERATVDKPGACVDGMVASLIERRAPSAVVAAGDLQYWRGEYENFMSQYEPRWGRVKNITYPVRGNHEYITPGADGHALYWGAKSLAYYSVDVGTWRMFVVDSTCLELNALAQCEVGTPQEKWLREGLATAASEAKCTLVVMHHPIISSGIYGSPELSELWSTIVNGGADVVVAGHDHLYERFSRLDAATQPVSDDLATPGSRLFVSGLGGMPAHRFVEPTEPGSEFRYLESHGVLDLSLSVATYSWQFVTTDDVVQDSGTRSCA